MMSHARQPSQRCAARIKTAAILAGLLALTLLALATSLGALPTNTTS
ncbi:hypothetical protein ACFVYG_32440 [Streptomyces sp. NPDC058256]